MRKEIDEKISQLKPTQVDLCNMQITDNEIGKILKSIKEKKPTVTDIFLSKNKISDSSAELILQACKELPNLKFLDLQFNDLDEPGIKILFNLKETHPKIEFALHGNKLVDEGKMSIIEQNFKKRF